MGLDAGGGQWVLVSQRRLHDNLCVDVLGHIYCGGAGRRGLTPQCGCVSELEVVRPNAQHLQPPRRFTSCEDIQATQCIRHMRESVRKGGKLEAASMQPTRPGRSEDRCGTHASDAFLSVVINVTVKFDSTEVYLLHLSIELINLHTALDKHSAPYPVAIAQRSEHLSI
jgi:hypothetical protein